MEYKQFIVRVFEHKPEKWRASVERVDGRALMAMTNRRKLFKFITGADARSAQDAVLMAIAAIDAGTFASIQNRARKTPSASRRLIVVPTPLDARPSRGQGRTVFGTNET
jgi:hypothetical protein